MPNEDKPKIIIDEDWKSQVQAEKEAAKHPSVESSAGEPPASAGRDPDEADQFPDDPEMPPASFEMLITGLATEAMMSLGQIPNPMTGEAKLRKNQAKYLIDTIGVLRDKTKGNLSPAEDQAVEDLLHQLRMAYVQITGA